MSNHNPNRFGNPGLVLLVDILSYNPYTLASFIPFLSPVRVVVWSSRETRPIAVLPLPSPRMGALAKRLIHLVDARLDCGLSSYDKESAFFALFDCLYIHYISILVVCQQFFPMVL